MIIRNAERRCGIRDGNKMVLTLIYLIQAHPPAKVSWRLWTAAILFFLIGLSLLIYVLTRPKETEADEVEDAGGRGLLATPEEPAAKAAAVKDASADEAAPAGKPR